MIKKSFVYCLAVMSLFALPLFAEEVDMGWIEGQMMVRDGGPMSKGMVIFFRADKGPVPDARRYLRIPDEVSDLDAEGKFSVALPVGKYFVGAIKRISGEQIGPPQDGDFFFNSRDDNGVLVEYIIHKDKTLNTGVIARAEPFMRMIAADASGISGTIRDMKDKPMEGATVFAYTTKTVIGIPAFISYRTAKDGKYVITMDKGGKYYIKVRDAYGGGPPLSGSVVGVSGGDGPTSVTIKTGVITQGVDIKVMRPGTPQGGRK